MTSGSKSRKRKGERTKLEEKVDLIRLRKEKRGCYLRDIEKNDDKSLNENFRRRKKRRHEFSKS